MATKYIRIPIFPTGETEKVDRNTIVGIMPMSNMHLADGTVLLLTNNRYILCLLDETAVLRQLNRQQAEPPPETEPETLPPWPVDAEN